MTSPAFRVAIAVASLVSCKAKPSPSAAPSPAPASDAAVSFDAGTDAAPPEARKEKKQPTFAAKATGSFEGTAWKPTFATVSVRDGKATLAVFDGLPPKCEHAFADNELQLLVELPYVVGKPVDIAKSKRPSGDDRHWDFGEVSLFHLYKKSFAKSYAGRVELTATPTDEDDLAHAKVDVRIDGVTLRGDFDAIVCMYE